MRSKRGKVLWPKLSLKSFLKNGPKNGGLIPYDDEETDSELDDEDPSTRHSSFSTQTYEASRWSFAGQHRRHSSAMAGPNNDILRKEQFRIFIGTWNVGGKFPQEKMNLELWLNLTAPADIYVIGFQEIVPLNAGNVLGVDDKSSVMRWLQLIQKALNKTALSDVATGYADNICPRRKSHSFSASLLEVADLSEDSSGLEFSFPIVLERAFLHETFDGAESIASFRSHTSAGKNVCASRGNDSQMQPPSCTMKASSGDLTSQHQYTLIASKRMVGIFLSVWVRDDLCSHVRHVKISSVGCGIMGYLGNKGSISISLCLHQTTFCFICTHLTSGEKEGDELRRNCDVSVILKRTRFCKSSQLKEGALPDTIFDHDCILWFGDLNYRLTLSSTSTKLLLARGDWEALLERDQLHIERRAGRVFKGWHEGKICFPPTYKYRAGSDSYAVERRKFGEKRRTPAWCDRILWYGKGLEQLEYVRAESNFSDHRPVYAVFLAEVHVSDPKKLKDFLT
ncbi:hypothetical protein GOP47_0027155 [Adiantum capillus-veneris]|nr:hypothetical protein GOP47_0027155 [Adiantum capillus-veneris]